MKPQEVKAVHRAGGGGAKCGARLRGGLRKGLPCEKSAGWGTDHVGVGRCKLHGGATPIKHGRYSKIARERLGDVMAEIEADPDPLNLLPELQLLRGILTKWFKESGGGKGLPPPMVAELTEKVAKIVDLMQKHKKEGVITLATLQRVAEQLGASVARHVKDPSVLAAIERDWGTIQLGS